MGRIISRCTYIQSDFVYILRSSSLGQGAVGLFSAVPLVITPRCL